MNKRLTTDMADANGLRRAIRPTGFFNIKKITPIFAARNARQTKTITEAREA